MAAVGVGVYTFFKMRRMRELIAILYQSRLIKAQGIVEECELPTWQIIELIIAIACIWEILKWVLPKIMKWIVPKVGVHYINVSQNPMVNHDYNADIYVKIKGGRRTEAVYLCTVNEDPSQISHTIPVHKPVIAMRGSCINIRPKLIIQWHDLEVYNKAEKKRAILPMKVRLPLTQVRAIREILTTDYVVSLIIGRCNVYEAVPLTIVGEASQPGGRAGINIT